LRSDYYDGVSQEPLRPLPPLTKPPKKPKQRRHRTAWKVFLIFLTLILICCGILAWHYGLFSPSKGNVPAPITPPESVSSPAVTTIRRVAPPGTGTLHPETGEAPELTATEIYQQVSPSIVTITTFDPQGNGHEGSGIIFDTNGYLLTNAHVIEGSASAWVTLSNGQEYPASLIGMDTPTDLAVLHIAAANLTAARFASDITLAVGETAYAIGNPLGSQFQGSMTDGIISAISRSVMVGGYEMTLIQTSAALNEGSSGGALVDTTGRVVGVTNMKMMSNYSTIEGLGFAIPSSTAEDVVDDLMAYGHVVGRPQLGITVRPATMQESPGGGLYVDSLFETSDAWAKGIRPGDILLTADGVTLNTNDDLLGCKEGLSAGDSIHITWRSAETGGQHSAEIYLVEDYILRGE